MLNIPIKVNLTKPGNQIERPSQTKQENKNSVNKDK